MKTLFLICILSIAAFGQIKAPKGFTADYDKFKDQTLVGFVGWAKGIQYIAEFEMAGKEATVDIEFFYLTFAPNRCSGFCFNDSKLILLLDGTPLDLGKHERLSDTATYLVRRSDFAKIASAKTGEFQVAYFEGKWDAKALAKFKTLLDLGTAKK